MGRGKMKRRKGSGQNSEIKEEASKVSEEDDAASRIPLTRPTTVAFEQQESVMKGRRLMVVQILAVVGCFLSVILLTCIIVLAVSHGDIRYCSTGPDVIPRDLDNPGVFDDMTPKEFIAVRDYMFKKTEIKLVSFENASVNSSYIYMIDLHMPLKSAVLEYLDRGTIRVERVAKVVVVRGDLEHPRVEEYLVKPLPEPNYHRLIVANPAYSRLPIPYASRPIDHVDYRHLFRILKQLSKDVYHIMMESYGLCYHNCTKGLNCLKFFDVAPRGTESGQRKSWFWAFRDVEGFYLHPLGFEVEIDHLSTDISKWKISKLVYNGRMFYLVQDLIERYKAGIVKKIRMDRPLGKINELYSSYYRRGVNPMPVPLQGPKLVEPDGRRYKIVGQHVKYMDWDFNVRMRTCTGIQIFDVRFQSERIAYEISLQEAAVFYSGYGPAQGTSNYFDTSWMMGASSFELVRGVDCPDTAVMLSAHHFVNSGKPKRYYNSICIFEQNPGIPLRRHYANDFSNGFTYYGGLVDYHLIVRHIVSIWNFDYIFDYIFHLNGAIEVRVSATGYVQAAYKLPFEKPYGNPIYYDVMADLHQHLFHFKADLDIGGLRNRYATLDIGRETVKHPWYHNLNKTQMTMSFNVQEREMDSVTDGDFLGSKYHLILNDLSKNKYGTSRAYRILNKGVSKFVLSNVEVANAAKWAKYPVAVTKHKDTEVMSSSIYAQNEPWDPVVDFERFLLDNDTIFDEDLVAWITLGVHHIPHTEDVPSTPTAHNQYSFFLVPFNFFTECPSVSSPSAVHINPGSNYEDNRVETFGTSFESKCAQAPIGPSSFYGY